MNKHGAMFDAHLKGIDMEPAKYRPLVTVEDGVVMLDGEKAKVIMRRDRIFVGCHDITPDAARVLLKKWDENFGESEYVTVQRGKEC